MNVHLVCTNIDRIPEVRTILDRATGRQEIYDGFVLKFPGDDTTARAVLEFALAERRCCAFFSYEVASASDHAHVTLTIRARGVYVAALKAMYGGGTAGTLKRQGR